VDCTLVYYGELGPTFQKFRQTTREVISLRFPHADLSATPTFSASHVCATGPSSGSRDLWNIELIWMEFAVLASVVRRMLFGPLR
jgi:hypothetical protein